MTGLVTGLLVALAGTAAGAAQAWLLARAAGGRAAPLAFLGRLLLVGAALLVALGAGRLALGMAGWAAGFVATGTLAHRRMA